MLPLMYFVIDPWLSWKSNLKSIWLWLVNILDKETASIMRDYYDWLPCSTRCRKTYEIMSESVLFRIWCLACLTLRICLGRKNAICILSEFLTEAFYIRCRTSDVWIFLLSHLPAFNIRMFPGITGFYGENFGGERFSLMINRHTRAHTYQSRLSTDTCKTETISYKMLWKMLWRRVINYHQYHCNSDKW